MMETFSHFQDWLLSFGESYGVNPIIFALLYFGTIPFSLLFFTIIIKNWRTGKSIALPLFGAFACYIGTYIYLFWIGKNIPLWVYGIIFGMMFYGGFFLVKKLRQLRKREK